MSENNTLAVVTGGTRGLGAAMCRFLVSEGFKVVAIFGGNTAVAQNFHREENIPIYQCDVADLSAVVETFSTIKKDHGDVGVLVNNAGITRDRMLHKMTPQDWHDVINTNLNAIFYTSQQVIGDMREKKFGRIINISSVNASLGQLGQANYVAAKSGVTGISRSMALETARYGITVNCVAPGYTDTDMVRAVPEKVLNSIIERIPVNRLGNVDEIARVVSFLAHKDSGFITGTTIHINGGQYLG